MKYVLKNVNILDGTINMELKENYSILINGNIIEKIAKEIKGDFKVLDMKGKYIIPGLINLHEHLPQGGKIGKKRNTKVLVNFIINTALGNKFGLALEERFAKESLKGGVTTLRSVGGLGHIDTTLRDKINKGDIVGPRIFASDYAITVEKGHMLGTLAVAFHNEEEMRQQVDDLIEHNVDQIKIMVTGGILDAVKVGEPGILRMQPEQIKSVCDYAHSKGLKVAAHVESVDGVKVAVENGVDTIEHGSPFDDSIIPLFKLYNACIVETLSPAIPEACLDRELLNIPEMATINAIVLTKAVIDGAKKCLKHGIKLGVGTDTGCPYVEHYNFYRELEWMHNLIEIDRKQCLYLATLNNAEILNYDKFIGSIEEGKLADLVIVDKNPLDDFCNLKDPSYVIKDGKFIRNLKIKKNEVEERELDKVQYIKYDYIENLYNNLNLK